MLRCNFPDSSCSAPRLLAALLAGIVAATAAPAAHADLSHAGVPADLEPAGVAADWPRLLAPVGTALDEQPPVQLWLTQAWPLGLAVRPAPTAMLTVWLTGGVHRVLSWIAQPRPAELAPGESDPALEQALGLITVEPVTGAETSSYGYRRDPFTRRRKLHKGVDYRAPRGTPVFAAGPGEIRVARRKSGYGRVIMIDHGAGVETRYAHLQSIEVDAGQRVSAGTRIGTVGSTGRATGPHLHFELRIDGDAHDPQDVLGPLVPAELAGVEY